MATSTTSSSSSSSRSAALNPVPMKLEDENFLDWKMQVLGAMKACKLEKFVTETNNGGMPHKFKTSEDEVLGNISEQYQNWEQQDQAVYSWLLASISPNLPIRMVQCKHAFQIWNKVEDYFEQKECEELHKTMEILKDKNSMLVQKLKNLSDHCMELCNENDDIEEELVKKYGPESVADLSPP